jgi:hypothetical protein
MTAAGTKRRNPPITLRVARAIAARPGGREVLAQLRETLANARECARLELPKAIDPGGDRASDVIRGLQLELTEKLQRIIREADAEILAIDQTLAELQA